MLQNISYNFNIFYRADCTTCNKYVGPKRISKPEADADKENHKSIPENKDHEVEIEVTQSSYI
jgi:hypothetical protein